jgi:hypothetical protein
VLDAPASGASPGPAATPSDAIPPPTAVPRATFAEQLALLKRARASLRSGRGQDALSLLDSRRESLRGGDLEAEARLLRIEALAATGRSAEARIEARRFIGDYPNSPLVNRASGFAQSAKGP